MVSGSIALNDVVRHKLPVWRTVKDAYALTLSNLATLFALSETALLIILPLTLLFGWYTSPVLAEILCNKDEPLTYGSVLALLSSVVYTAVAFTAVSPAAVGWHRFLLRDEPPQGFTAHRRRAVRYAAVFAALTAGLHAASLLGLLIPAPNGTAVVFVLSLVAMVLYFRFSLVLPAIALDDSNATAPAAALKAGRGNTFRLVLGGFLSGMPFAIPSLLTLYFLGGRFDPPVGAVLQTAAQLIGFFGLAVMLAFVSLAYQHLFGQERLGEGLAHR